MLVPEQHHMEFIKGGISIGNNLNDTQIGGMLSKMSLH